jgi:hypothetical protein
MYEAGHQQQLWTTEAADWLAMLAAHLADPAHADRVQ